MSDETPTPDKPTRTRRSPRSTVATTDSGPADATSEAVQAEPQAEPIVEPVTVATADDAPAVEPQPAASVPTATTGEQPVAATGPQPTAAPVSIAQTGAVQTGPVQTAAVQTIYVHAPQPPKRRGNRVIGTLIALASAVLFGVLYAVVLTIIVAAQTGVGTAAFLGSIDFYVPVLFFAAGSIVVVLIVNRAGWWAHVIGSLLVGLFVYFGTVGTGLLIGGVVLETPQGAARLFGEALTNPFVIAAGLLAREVTLWTGAPISARGRRLKARNAEARAAYDEDSARQRAEYERAIAEARARAADVV